MGNYVVNEAKKKWNSKDDTANYKKRINNSTQFALLGHIFFANYLLSIVWKAVS